jgi:hypothetical protein
MGSFEGHAVVRRVVQWAFGADAVATQRALVDDDTGGTEAALGEVIRAWVKLCHLCGGDRLSLVGALTALEGVAAAGQPIDGDVARGFLHLGYPGKKSAQSLGLKLKKFVDQDTVMEVNEYRLVMVERGRQGRVYSVQQGRRVAG